MLMKYKFNAFLKHPGCNFDGGSDAPAQTTTVTSNVPEYAQPYFERLLGKTETLTGEVPYTPYAGLGAANQRVAGFDPMQSQAAQGVQGLYQAGTPQSMLAGQGLVSGAAQRTAGFQYNPMGATYQNVGGPTLANYQMQQPASVAGAQMGQYERVNAPSLQGFSMQAAPDINAQQIAAGQLGPQLSSAAPGQVQAFMSPYQQQAVDVEKAAAVRDYQIANQMRGAQAARAGAFGGSRQAVESAEAQRGLMSQLQAIQAKGSQSAFDQAQQALQAERAAQMQAGTTNIQSALQAAQANQQSGLAAAQANQQAQQQASLQNLSAALQTQGLQAQTGLQAQQSNQQAGLTTAQQNAQMMQQAALANQQAGLTTGQQNLQALLATQQLGTQTGMQAALANQQAFADAQRAAEQSRQFGATTGLSAAAQQAEMGKALGAMGSQEQQDFLARAQAMYGMGQQQQQLSQQQINNAYQQYLDQLNYPYKQLGFLSDILHGTQGVGSASQVYQSPPSGASQLASLGLGAYGMSSLFGTPAKAKGGQIKKPNAVKKGKINPNMGKGLAQAGLFKALKG